MPSFYLLGLYSPIYLDNGPLEPGYPCNCCSCETVFFFFLRCGLHYIMKLLQSLVPIQAQRVEKFDRSLIIDHFTCQTD